VLTTGEAFSGPAELKTLVKAKKRDLFVRNLASRMLSYSLRRGLEFYDSPAVKQIAANLEKNDYRGAALIAEIVKSYPFQYRRDEPVPEDHP
jgi:hypothetical protein